MSTSSATAGDFCWPVLNHVSCTRLLKIHASSAGPRLTGEILSVELSHAPSYETLSYVWGPANGGCEIELNGAMLPITSTVFQALQYLQRNDEPRILWIDQICINQADSDERNSQVRLMGHIYSQASSVIVWLGPKHHNDEVMLGVISKLASLSESSPEELLELAKTTAEQIGNASSKVALGIVPRVNSKAEMEQHYISDLFGGYHWIWTFVLGWLQKDWFDRTWCFQEAVLARRCELVVGDLSLPWDTLYRACDTIRKSGLRHVLMDRHTPVLVIQHHRELLLGETPRSLRLLDLVGVIRKRESSVPHDKIYGVLGLAQMSSDAPLGFDVDYNKAFQEVYADLVKAMIHRHRSLEVLSYVQQHHDPLLPSWCPDWREKSRTHLVMGSRNHQGRASYTATLDSRPTTIDPEDSHGLLKLRSCLIGRIIRELEIESASALGLAYRQRQYIGSERWKSMYWIGLYIKTVLTNQLPIDAGTFSGRSDRYLADLCKGHLDDPDGPVVKLVFALWRTLTTDMLPGSGRLVTEDGDDSPQRSFTEYFAWERTGFHGGVPAKVYQEYEDRAIEWLAGRTIVLIEDTQGRHHLALVPEHVECGDDLVLLQGGVVPFAVRKASAGTSSYHLLGESYVDGVMDGEWLDVAERDCLWQDLAFV